MSSSTSAKHLTRHDDGIIETVTLGRGLSFFVPSLQAHSGQDVIVVGGGGSASDWALSLEPIARSVTLVHRRAAFRAHAHTVDQLHASTVDTTMATSVPSGHSSDVLPIAV